MYSERAARNRDLKAESITVEKTSRVRYLMRSVPPTTLRTSQILDIGVIILWMTSLKLAFAVAGSDDFI